MLPAEPLGGTLVFFASLGAAPPTEGALDFFVSCVAPLPRGNDAFFPGGTLFFLGSVDATAPTLCWGPFLPSLGVGALLSSATAGAAEPAAPEAGPTLALDVGPTDFGGSLCS
jgi:hypothetical protein